MIRVLKLLLPALIPAWNFFDVIAASPRIEFALLTDEDEIPSVWNEFRPHPERVSFMRMLGRMLWNPIWNESLFIVSCAERIIEHPMQTTSHSEDEILKRIEADLVGNVIEPYLQFRLLLVRREGLLLQQEPVYLSRVVSVSRKLAQGDSA